jgi:hypothetical protein
LADFGPDSRPWYENAKARWTSGQQALTFSSVYPFATSGTLGISPTGAIVQNGVFKGVWAMDYELQAISDMLKQVASSPDSWSYAIERTGASAGSLIGSTRHGGSVIAHHLVHFKGIIHYYSDDSK